MNSLVPVLAALMLATTAVFAASEAILAPPQSAPEAFGELLISRDVNAPNACDIELYVQNELVARVAPGQSVSIPVPAGEVSLRVAQHGSSHCAGQFVGTSQSAIIEPGEVRHLRIVQDEHEVFLAPAAD